MAWAMVMENPQTKPWTQECLDAARVAAECADWCIQNNGSKDCIRQCLDASNLATTTAGLMVRESGYASNVIMATGEAFAQCADTCGPHSGEHDVFDRCAAACSAAAAACRNVAQQTT